MRVLFSQRHMPAIKQMPRMNKQFLCIHFNRLWAQYQTEEYYRMNYTRYVSHIAKFNGKNFQLWKFGLWLLLKRDSLVNIVTGEEKKPTEILTNEILTNSKEIADWEQKDNLASNDLIATIETAQQRALVNCSTAHEIWERISTQHLRSAAEDQHVLQQRFYEYQYQSEHDMLTHIIEIETMAAQLKEVGAQVSDVQIMAKIICTLPHNYSNFATAWDSVAARDKTISALKSRLLKEEDLVKSRNNAKPDSADSAFFVQNRSLPHNRRGHDQNHNRMYRSKPYLFCTYCRKQGHIAERGRHRIRDFTRDRAQDRDHFAAAATFTRQDRNSTQPEPKNEETAFLSTTRYDGSASLQWFADSGATKHMTGQRHVFAPFFAVKTDSWIVKGIGHEKLEVRGYGDVKFMVKVNGSRREATIREVLFVPGLGVNLISIAAFTDTGFTVHFVETEVCFTITW